MVAKRLGLKIFPNSRSKMSSRSRVFSYDPMSLIFPILFAKSHLFKGRHSPLLIFVCCFLEGGFFPRFPCLPLGRRQFPLLFFLFFVVRRHSSLFFDGVTLLVFVFRVLSSPIFALFGEMVDGVAPIRALQVHFPPNLYPTLAYVSYAFISHIWSKTHTRNISRFH